MHNPADSNRRSAWLLNGWRASWQRHISVIFLLLVSAGLLFVAELSAAGPAIQVNSLLWQIQAPGGKASYVFGTMHTDDPRVNDFSAGVKKALATSDIFMMEVLPPSDASAYFMPHTNLRELLTAKELAQVDRLAQVHGLEESIALRMKPWLLAMVFDLPKSQSPYAQDVQLMQQAQSQSKELIALEDTEAHFGMLDNFSMADQLAMLRAVLKRTQAEKQRDYDTLIKAYLSGNIDKIAAVDAQLTGDTLSKALWDRMRGTLLDGRNAGMAARIVEQAQQRSVFVAVGAAHLAGKDGLLARLKAAGFQVARVQP